MRILQQQSLKRLIEFLCFGVFFLQLLELISKLFFPEHYATYLNGFLADNPLKAIGAPATILRV